ncbi:hypothetical protein DNTS_033026 [Danionella cerebrum]|uniref:Transmembrane protein 81 n=1 Tax=Danionella cerebrum TaxID=2873325 RepID=A0A553NN35_9TELE|nr:hypothetical protein DNTS_033026 [Danionella translucida]
MPLSTLWLMGLVWMWLHSSTVGDILTEAELQELEKISTWVISRSFPCSATCGLGLRNQELCPIGGNKNTAKASCKMRTISCLDNWHCGLKTQTVNAGKYLELDCVEEVIEAMGHYAFVVSWRFAAGIITSDDTLFAKYETLNLDKVVLDPVQEKDSGTYRCDVLDTDKRRVKRMYKGVKVLSPNELRLDFAKGLAHWEKPGSQFLNTTTGNIYLRNAVLIRHYTGRSEPTPQTNKPVKGAL